MARARLVGIVADVRVSVPVSSVFPGTTADFETFCALLRELSRGDVLFTSARLNLVLSNPDGPPSAEIQCWAARRFLDAAELKRLDRFAASHGGPEVILLFCRAQLLEVMRWACLLSTDQPGEGETFREPSVRRRFVQVALIAGELWERRTYPNGLSVSDDRGADRMRAMTSLRAGIEATRQAPELKRVLARCSATYERRLEQHRAGTAAAFQKATGLTFIQYAAFATALQLDFCALTPTSEDALPKIFNQHTVGRALLPAASAALPNFLSLESQTPDELRGALLSPGGAVPGPMDHFSLRPLYERPVLCAPDGRAIIMDSAVFVEKIALGSLFHLVRATRQPGAVNTLFAAFGYCFEEYAQDVLARIWQDLLRSPTRSSSAGDTELTDAAVIVGSKLFLFEVKSAFVRDSTTQCDSSDDYMTELREKYVRGQRDGKPTQKGVAQLSAAVKRVAADGFLVTPGDLEGVTQIYSVLVGRDAALGAPGHVEFFAREFDELISPGCSRGTELTLACGRYGVAPLIVATIEDLEDIEPSADKWDVAAFLHDYTRREDLGARPSLRDFMVTAQLQYPVYPSRMLAEMAVKHMAETAQFLYAESVNDAPTQL